MLSPILAIFARISKPLWLNIRSTGAEAETETRGFQDQDQDSEVPRPRPRLVKTGLETKTQVSRTPSLLRMVEAICSISNI